MPVRSLRSSVFRWPDRAAVHAALAAWAAREVRAKPWLRRVGYVGSYATGNWGPGSDVDVVLVVTRAEEPRSGRGAAWDLNDLPVPADVLVYTVGEWDELVQGASRFGQVAATETVWVYDAEAK